MTEPEPSVGTTEESVTNHPEDGSQQSIEDFVTERAIHEKEFSLSIDYGTENPFHLVSHRDRDPTISAVAGTLEDIKEWVNENNDEEWELDQFTLETTIVVQQTETRKDDAEEPSFSE